MKCPKCGYLGFEATDRCRNCGYDFSLVGSSRTPELVLRSDATDLSVPDLSLHPDAHADGAGDEVTRLALSGEPEPVEDEPPVESAVEDLPLFSPRPAGPPLAVRRATTDAPRPRRTTRTARLEPPLPLLPEVDDTVVPPVIPPVRSGPRALPAEAASVGARLAAAGLDVGLLLAIDAAVIVLTLRITGLEPTAGDLAVLPVIPMVAFLAVLAFLYLVGFSVGGGQTIGKMFAGIRVTGDDGRGVDMTGAVVRALGCLVMAGTLGLAYVPVLMSADRRGLHDRLAGTRVVVA